MPQLMSFQLTERRAVSLRQLGLLRVGFSDLQRRDFLGHSGYYVGLDIGKCVFS